jgi:hypothetical protein
LLLVMFTYVVHSAIQAAPSHDYMIPVELESASKVIAVMLTIVNTIVCLLWSLQS